MESKTLGDTVYYKRHLKNHIFEEIISEGTFKLSSWIKLYGKESPG